MSTNDRNESAADKNDRAYFDSEGAPDGELSQDELDNVSGGRYAMKADQPDGIRVSKTDGQPDFDPSNARVS